VSSFHCFFDGAALGVQMVDVGTDIGKDPIGTHLKEADEGPHIALTVNQSYRWEGAWTCRDDGADWWMTASKEACWQTIGGGWNDNRKETKDTILPEHFPYAMLVSSFVSSQSGFYS
jgi:hypothetical protein